MNQSNMLQRTGKYEVINAAKAAGVALTDAGYKIEVFCPVGQVIKGLDLHHISYYTKGWLRHQLYKEIISDLKRGTEPCSSHAEGSCDCCEEGIFIPSDINEQDILFKPALAIQD